MKTIISTERKPIKFWLDSVPDDGALAQAKNLANLPFVYKHIVILPDFHLGFGMPIGGVMASQEMIIPNAVGVDIGCGMCAVRTSLTTISTEKIKALLGLIRAKIPLGFNHHKSGQDPSLMPKAESGELNDLFIISREYNNALTQLGTLGGGNHFIEIQKGNDGHIWLMVHSGSRNLGYKVAQYYNRLAIDLNRKWKSKIPSKWQLAFLPADSENGRRYLMEMNFCVEFAYANRKLMMERVKEALQIVLTPVFFDPMINIAHNYASLESHFNNKVFVHRKGATSAKLGEVGIIPGSQGTPSYLVKGRGNRESFTSCSHGAGRKMGRKQAQRQLDLTAEKKKLDDQGIIHAVRHTRDLDESSGAYKNIDEVINNQLDLVEVLVELRPLAVIKG